MNDRDKQIIDLYLNHPELSNQDIANLFNISISTVSRIARLNNLQRRTGNNGIKLNQQQIQEIQNKYCDSIPLITLQNEYHISYDRIKNIVKNCNNISSAKRLNPTLNEDYFEIIDSDEKAYWLGWIISDGAITNNKEKSKFQLELTLKQSDEDILHLLEKDLGVFNKVYKSQNIYFRFSLGCKKIIEDLEKLGISNNKSLVVKVPFFDKKFNSSFIRGIFDGDGGFTRYKRSSGQICCELSFCGNEFIINWVANTLFNEIPQLTRNKITNEHSIKRIRWSKKSDIELLKIYLYQNHNNHYLRRKHDLIYANPEVTSQITKG